MPTGMRVPQGGKATGGTPCTPRRTSVRPLAHPATDGTRIKDFLTGRSPSFQDNVEKKCVSRQGHTKGQVFDPHTITTELSLSPYGLLTYLSAFQSFSHFDSSIR